MPIHFEAKQFGFVYGSAEITRIHSEEKTGRVFMDLTTPKGSWQIHVSKTGKVRIFGPTGELGLLA